MRLKNDATYEYNLLQRLIFIYRNTLVLEKQ